MRVFVEKQRFTQWWLWLLIATILLVVLVPTMVKTVENKNISLLFENAGFLIGTTTLFLVSAFLMYCTLKTKIDETGITYQFIPFHLNKKGIYWSEVKKVYVRRYNPLLEYGGWGYRIGKSGKAYNAKGNQGIQLELKNGKKLLLGTQKPKEAQQVIDRYFNNEGI